MSDVITIGIAGGTGSGKTTITRRILDEFGGDVCGIRGASPVAEEQNFVAVVEGLGDECGDLHDTIDMRSCKLLFDVGTFCKSLQYHCLHGRDSRRGGSACQTKVRSEKCAQKKDTQILGSLR